MNDIAGRRSGCPSAGSGESDLRRLFIGHFAIMFPHVNTERIFVLARRPDFARYLHDARLRRGLSVAEVAEQVGVSGPCVYYWEMGRTRPRDANLTALCRALRLPVRATREMAAAG